jgi:PAS domain S-box-containing protein
MIKSDPLKETNEEALRKSIKEASDYKYALEESFIVATTDQEGIISYVNDNFCKVSKYRREELIGQDHRIMNSGFHTKEFISNLWTTIANGKIWRGELKNKARDGTYYWVDTTIVPFLDNERKPYQYVASSADITAQKKAEGEVIKACDEREIVLNRISYGVISLDNEWRYTFLNDAALAAHPLGKQETLGKVIWDVHPRSKGTVFWDKYHEARLTQKEVEMETYYAPLNSYFSIKIYPSPDGLTIFYKDITESKNAELELSQSLKEVKDYKFALDEASIVAITDQKGVINYVNNNFCKISKYSRRGLIGQDHRIINSGFHPKEFIHNLWVTIAKGKIWRGELKNKTQDGTFYWADTTIVPFLDEHSKPYQYIAISADITARKLAEEENLNLNEELEDRVKQRTEEMEAFSYSISHDLRAPLRAVNGYAKILEEDYANVFDSEGKRLLTIVQNNAKKMGMLIDALLTFSRLGRKEINKSVVNMTTLAENAVGELKTSMQFKAIIKIDNLHPVIADATLMNQVWANLLSNAVKYSFNTKKPVIKINSVKKNSELIYSISDNGVGFDMQYAHKLFGVFQRLHSDEDFEGTGVGLALVHRIITRQGGKIWANAEIDKGATFYFSLPEKATN